MGNGISISSLGSIRRTLALLHTADHFSCRSYVPEGLWPVLGFDMGEVCVEGVSRDGSQGSKAAGRAEIYSDTPPHQEQTPCAHRTGSLTDEGGGWICNREACRIDVSLQRVQKPGSVW